MTANIITRPYIEDDAIKRVKESGIIDINIWPCVIDEDKKTGITKAHKNIVRWAKESRLERVLIMEEDVFFTHKIDFSIVPDDFDLFLFGVSTIVRRKGSIDFTGMHCYIVHSRFYDKFLSVPDNQHIDYSLSQISDAKYSNPFIAFQIGYEDKIDSINGKIKYL